MDTSGQKFRREIHYVLEGRHRMRATVVRVPLISESYDSCLPGFSKVSNKKLPYYSRILWLFVSLGLFGICFYQIGERIDQYIENQSSIKKYYVTKKAIDFPSVTFCREGDVINEHINIWERLADSKIDYDNFMKSGKINVYDLWNSSTPEFTELDVTLNDVPGNAELIDQSKVYTQFGLCHMVTPRSKLEFSVSELSLTLRWPEIQMERRLVVMIHNKEELAVEQFLLSQKNITISKEAMTDCVLQITQHISRNTQNSFCVSDGKAVECIAGCLWQHLNSNVIDPCRLPFMQRDEQFPLCSTGKDITHMMAKISNVSHSFDPKNCMCPKKCHETMYAVSSCHKQRMKGGLRIKIYENKIPLVEEKRRYRWCSLCCDLGGSIGLWLGICIIQLMTIIKANISKCLPSINPPIRETTLRHRKTSFFVFVCKAQEVVPNENACFSLYGIRNLISKNHFFGKGLWIILYAATAYFGVCLCVIQVVFYISHPFATKTHKAQMRTIPMSLMTFCLEPEGDILPAWEPALLNLAYGRSLEFSEALQALENGTVSIIDMWNMSRIHIKPSKNPSKIAGGTIQNECFTVAGTCFTVILDTFIEKTKIYFTWKYRGARYLRVIFHDNDDDLLLPYLPKIKGYKIGARSYNEFRISFVEINEETCQPGNVSTQCLQKCIEGKIFSKFVKPCSLPFMKHYKGIPVCISAKDLTFVVNATINTLNTILLEECHCPKKCKEVLYNVRQVSHTMPEDKLTVVLKPAESTYEVLEEYSIYTAVDLFSDLGSALGLFLGTCGLHAIDAVVGLFCKTLSACQIRFSTMQKRDLPPVVNDVCNESGIMEGCEVSVPGFEKVLKKDSALWVRSFWLVISILALFGCIYQCAVNVMYFLSDPSEVNMHIDINQTIAYPLVVICSEDEILKYDIEDMDYLPLYSTIEDLWITHRLDITMVELSVNMVPDDSIIVAEEDTLDGRCLVVRPTEQLPYVGRHSSLFINITTPHPGYGYRSARALQQTDEFLLVSYEKNSNFHKVNDQAQKIILSLVVQEEIFRNTALHPCADGEHVSKCQVDCIESRIYANTSESCRLPFMQNSTLIPACKTFEQLKTIYEFAQLYKEELQRNSVDSCFCPRKCRQLWYWYDNKNIVNDWYKSTLEVTIHIPDNQIHVMEEVPSYSIFKLLSDIGGTLGLYFGLGLLQILELTQFLLLKTVGRFVGLRA